MSFASLSYTTMLRNRGGSYSYKPDPGNLGCLKVVPASAICLTCPYIWNALARNLPWLMLFPNPPLGPFLNWCCKQVSICLFEVICCGNTVQDEKSCSYIHSFHSSALPIMEYSPNAKRPYSSLACSEPIWTIAWVPGHQPTSWLLVRKRG